MYIHFFRFFSHVSHSVQFSFQSLSRVRLFATLWITQHARPPCPSPTPRVTHGHRVGDAIQPSHPLSSPSPPAPNPSQHQGLFQWVNSSHQVAKVLEFQLQHQSSVPNSVSCAVIAGSYLSSILYTVGCVCQSRSPYLSLPLISPGNH